MSNSAVVRKRQLEKNDPLVQKIAEQASIDPEYVELMNYLESDRDINPEMPQETDGGHLALLSHSCSIHDHTIQR